MYFKYTVLLTCLVLIVNPVVGPRGIKLPIPAEDEVLDSYYRKILKRLGKQETDIITMAEFFTFLGEDTVNRDVVQNFFDNNQPLKVSRGRINLDLFKSLVRGISGFLVRNIDRSIYLPMTPIAFTNDTIRAWDIRTGYQNAKTLKVLKTPELKAPIVEDEYSSNVEALNRFKNLELKTPKLEEYSEVRQPKIENTSIN